MGQHLAGGTRGYTLRPASVKQQPVGTYREWGQISWGVQDLMGNVWEWTSSKASGLQGQSGLELQAQLQGLGSGSGRVFSKHRIKAISLLADLSRLVCS